MFKTWLLRAGVFGGIAAVASVTTATTANAANYGAYIYVNNQFRASMQFTDYGDEFSIWDGHADGHGVRGWLYYMPTSGSPQLLKTKYNGAGTGTDATFTYNIRKGNSYTMKVCLVDGANDTSPGPCDSEGIIE